jgi:hypothetical protein
VITAKAGHLPFSAPLAVSIWSFGDPLLAVKANLVIAFVYLYKDLPPSKLFPSNFVYTCSISSEPCNTSVAITQEY